MAEDYHKVKFILSSLLGWKAAKESSIRSAKGGVFQYQRDVTRIIELTPVLNLEKRS